MIIPRRFTIAFLPALLLVLTAACELRAQAVPDATGGIQFSANRPSVWLTLQGGARLAGISPLVVRAPISGDFWLRSEGRGFERQRGRVSIALDDRGSRIVGASAPGTGETMAKSLVFPGVAQILDGDRGKGSAMAAVGATAAIWAVRSQIRLGNASDETDAARQDAQSGIDPAGEEARLNRLHDAQQDEQYARRVRKLSLIGAGAVWGLSLVDAICFAPEFRVSGISSNELTLDMREKTRGGAVIRSLVFPGLGQAYNGHPNRALLVATGGFAVSANAVRSQLRYEQALRDLYKVDDRIGTAIAFEERQSLILERQVRFDRADQRYDARRIAFGLALGYWALAAVDAAQRPSGDRVGGHAVSVGMSADPARSMLAARIRF